jgi:hypothetical protein
MNEYARPEGFIIFGNKQTFKLFTPWRSNKAPNFGGSFIWLQKSEYSILNRMVVKMFFLCSSTNKMFILVMLTSILLHNVPAVFSVSN